MPHVLLIEDNAPTRRVIARILTRLGFEVSQADDGISGIATLNAIDRLDLMLVDWKMPGLSGLAVVEYLRKDDRFRRTPVVMITAIDDVLSAATALVAGVQAYLLKPFSELRLRQQLSELGFAIPDVEGYVPSNGGC